MDMMSIRRAVISNQIALIGKSGNPISFRAALPSVPSCVMNILPHQSGTGNPSPQNVRPLSGYDNMTIYRTGKNLFRPLWFTNRTVAGITSVRNADGSIQMTGTATSVNRYAQSTGFMVLPAGTYTAKGSPNSVTVRQGTTRVDTNGTFTSDGETALNLSVTFTSGNTYDIEERIWIEIGSEAGEYEPFGDAYSYTFDSAIYGGTLNVLTGVLSVEWGMKTLGSLSWFYNETYDRFSATFSAITEPGTARVTPLYCSELMPVTDGRAVVDVPSNSIYAGGTSTHNIYVHGTGYTTEEDLKAALGDAQIAYPLREPVTVQLTAHEVSAIIGQNNIWMDASGNIGIQYYGN